jgi:glycosyltransferase involved in cell wall biosynthesis
MPSVLIPTSDDDPGLIEAYRSLGWDVTVGAIHFRIRGPHYHVVHHQWPEEYSGWQVPTEQQIAEIEEHLRWWASQATNIFTVHNLYPHSGVRHPACHKLYSCFYRYCHVISHFSHTSHRLVLKEFPVSRGRHHVVHCPASNHVALTNQKQRGGQRADMGIKDDEFVILMIGRIRSWREVKLIQQAFDLARVPKKRLLMAGKFAIGGPKWRRRVLELRWNWWLNRRGAVVDTRYVPENELSRFLDSSDVAIVPRFEEHLNSGIVFLAMTFGRMVIVPNCGAYPEQLAGSRNLLFEAGDAESLASKLEEATTLDTDDIGRENAAIAAKWSWRETCRMCLDAAREQGSFVPGSTRVASA